MNTEEQLKYMVCVTCYTFNHVDYIIDAMNGFTMQQTNFPYICTILDDASTDGEQEVIKKYLQEHFDMEDKSVVRNEETGDYVLTFVQHKTNRNCYFAVLYLKYNHYSIRKSKRSYIEEWMNVKYVSLCEGDDYWTHPKKLQMQVEYLEGHLDYTMTCNRTKLFSVKRNRFVGENYCYNQSQTVKVKDIIYRTGLYISTCSILYRKEITNNIPDYWRKCMIGDYPLQIMCAMKGKVFYSNDTMSVYRVENPTSWMGQQKWGRLDFERLEVIKSRIDMLKGFAIDFPTYTSYFYNKIANEVNRNVPHHLTSQELKQYKTFFFGEIANYTYLQKIDFWLRSHPIPKITGLYLKLFQSHYNQRKKMY